MRISSFFRKKIGNIFGLLLLSVSASAADVDANIDIYNVSWDVVGSSSAESMPLGNGDIALNVWTESNGDINFYISKTDAWSEQNESEYGLLKLGQVRVSMNPAPSLAPFSQTLKLRNGEIEIAEGNRTFRIWVDANNPAIHVEAESPDDATMNVSLINWRNADENGISADVILDKNDQIAWYHRNRQDANPHVANRTFGAIMKGENLTKNNNTNLTGKAAGKTHRVSIYPLTTTEISADEWYEKANAEATRIGGIDLEAARSAHQDWWNEFWHRSWVFVKGDDAAHLTTQGYILQRFKTACAGRGKYPIKFNGSIFTVDNPDFRNGDDAFPVNADFRKWGGQYWFQNTRAMYWPRLAAGDFDIMLPLFNMYRGMLEDNARQVREYYNHEGSYFAETAPFWGGLDYAGPDADEHWTRHYFTPILELSMMMLDYYEFTQDKEFARETLMPVAKAGIKFFDKHFGRDNEGKLSLNPDNAIEMFWKVNNPAPDIAGLKSVLSRLIELPADLATEAEKADWRRFLAEIPDLPIGISDGKEILLPYTGEQNAEGRNGENPELYSIYPFRLYGLTKDDIDLAQYTFGQRKQIHPGCWSQDIVQAAMLGDATTAKAGVVVNFMRKDPRQKFMAFWDQANDYAPDEDNGGNAEHALQQMIMYTDGKKIILNAAWPVGWNCDFKLNAPFNTTVEGSIINGSVGNLVVTPESRRNDIVIKTPASYPVTAYEHCDFGGWAVGMQTGNYTLEQMAAIGVANDALSSLKVSDGYKVTLYSDNNFEGESITLTSDNDCLASRNFDNVASSMTVERIYPVTVFGQCGYEGFSVGLEAGDYTMGQLASMGAANDDISSVKISDGYKVTLYFDDNYEGGFVELTSDNDCLTSLNFDNQASSVRVESIFPTGIENTAETGSGVSVTPNPARDIISVTAPWDIYRTSIYDAAGKLLLQQENTQKTSRTDIGALQNGLYIVIVSNGNAKETTVIVKN